MRYWLVKSDPEEFGWEDLVRDKQTEWTGVRSYAARNHLRDMSAGDEVLFYHSGKVSAVVGIAKVKKAAYSDPTADNDTWLAVSLTPLRQLAKSVSLAEIRKAKELKDMLLLKISRLSVMPVQEREFQQIIERGTGK